MHIYIIQCSDPHHPNNPKTATEPHRDTGGQNAAQQRRTDRGSSSSTSKAKRAHADKTESTANTARREQTGRQTQVRTKQAGASRQTKETDPNSAEDTINYPTTQPRPRKWKNCKQARRELLGSDIAYDLWGCWGWGCTCTKLGKQNRSIDFPRWDPLHRRKWANQFACNAYVQIISLARDGPSSKSFLRSEALRDTAPNIISLVGLTSLERSQ